MARPKKELDKKTFELLCGIQATEMEICEFMDVTDKTLTRWCKETYGMRFSEVYAQKSAKGKISVRRAMFQMAQTTPSVMIFWAKNHLGMSDKIEQEVQVNYSDDEAVKEMHDFFKCENRER